MPIHDNWDQNKNGGIENARRISPGRSLHTDRVGVNPIHKKCICVMDTGIYHMYSYRGLLQEYNVSKIFTRV